MGHTITQQLIVHLVWTESLSECLGNLRHIFEEASPDFVCKSVQFFFVPFQSNKRIASEELVRVELSNRSTRFEKDKVLWLTEALAHPTVTTKLRQRRDRVSRNGLDKSYGGA